MLLLGGYPDRAVVCSELFYPTHADDPENLNEGKLLAYVTPPPDDPRSHVVKMGRHAVRMQLSHSSRTLRVLLLRRSQPALPSLLLPPSLLLFPSLPAAPVIRPHAVPGAATRLRNTLVRDPGYSRATPLPLPLTWRPSLERHCTLLSLARRRGSCPTTTLRSPLPSFGHARGSGMLNQGCGRGSDTGRP